MRLAQSEIRRVFILAEFRIVSLGERGFCFFKLQRLFGLRQLRTRIRKRGAVFGVLDLDEEVALVERAAVEECR